MNRGKQGNFSTFLLGKLFREEGSERTRVGGDVMDDTELLSVLQYPKKATVTHVVLITANGSNFGIQRTWPWNCTSLCGQIDIEGTFALNNPCHLRGHSLHCYRRKTKESMKFPGQLTDSKSSLQED